MCTARPLFSAGAAEETGHAAHQCTVAKHHDSAGHQLMPVAMAPYWPLGREPARFLGGLRHVAAKIGHFTEAACVRAAHRRISCANV